MIRTKGQAKAAAEKVWKKAWLSPVNQLSLGDYLLTATIINKGKEFVCSTSSADGTKCETRYYSLQSAVDCLAEWIFLHRADVNKCEYFS